MLNQFIYDASVLYGLVSSFCGPDNACEIVSTYADDNNGIAAFADLIVKYGGSPSVKLIVYEEEINKPFSFSYKGGLQAYLKNFEQNFIKHTQTENKVALMENRESLAMLDNIKRDKLFKNLYHEPTLRNIIQLAKSNNLDYQETLAYLNDESILVDHYDNSYAKKKSTQKAIFSDVDMEEFHAYMMQ